MDWHKLERIGTPWKADGCKGREYYITKDSYIEWADRFWVRVDRPRKGRRKKISKYLPKSSPVCSSLHKAKSLCEEYEQKRLASEARKENLKCFRK